MANSAPPWIRDTEWVVNVDNTPVPQVEVNKTAAGGVGRYAGAATTYQTVKSWTVTTGKTGTLKEVSMVSDNYAKTVFKVIVGSVTFMTDTVIKTALTLPFDEAYLAAGTAVTIQAKSSDGTTITVDGAIVGLEF